MPSHDFNTIFGIESLPGWELQTGTELFNRTIVPQCKPIPDFHTVLRKAVSKAEFFSCLDELRDDYSSAESYPILHIEAHGASDHTGYILSSGDLLTWAELRQHFQDISAKTKFNFVVISAACSGTHLVKSMRPTERAPFWGVLGPTTDVCNDDLLRGMEAFYTALLKTEDGDFALRALVIAAQAARDAYTLLTAETFFCWSYEQYEMGSTELEIEERIRRVVDVWARKNTPDVMQTAVIRAQARELVTDHVRWYDHLKRTFLWLDLFPENESRFSLNYDECRGNRRPPDTS